MQDDERRHLARELHDSTGQMLTAMKMNLDRLKAEPQNSETSSLIAKSQSINDELSRQLRTMSYLLHPPLLDETGLVSAVGWYTEGFTERSGIKVELETSPGFDRLPNDMEIAIFRVIQECLTNIHRHSHSPTANIRLTRTNDGMRLDVIDTGNGIPSHRLRGDKVIEGIGIMGIKERIRQFAGTLS
jgi:signal transduction histidine kinase